MTINLTNYANLQAAMVEELNRASDATLIARIPDFIYLFEQDLRADQEFLVERYSIANGGQPLPITTHPFQLPDYVRFVKSMRAAGGAFRHPLTLVTRADLWQRQNQSLSGNWNQMLPGIPVIVVVEPQVQTWMGGGGQNVGIGPWVEFWPSPVGTPVPGAGGATATATITNGQVTSVTVTNGGAGYDPNNPPSVMFLGGGPGTGAGATAVVSAGGVITSVTVTNAGSNYTTAPSVAFAGFAVDLVYVRDFVSIATDPNGANAILRLHPSVYLYGSLLHSAPWLQHDDRIGVWENLYTTALKRMNREMERAQSSDVPKRARFKAFQV